MNATLLHGERLSQGKSVGVNKEFCQLVNDLAMNDIGFVGPQYTWRRTNAESRIDRVLASTRWLERFPNVMVTHLPWYKSDHRPLLLNLQGLGKEKGRRRPFRFIAAWVLHDKFDSFVQENWNSSLQWNDNVLKFADACGKWNREEFGHTTRRKRIIMSRLEGISRAEARYGLSTNLEKLQGELWKELDDVMLQDHVLWAQKSRSDWYINGDRNTRFFHAKANGRRKRNYIGALKNDEGEWIYDVDLLKGMATSFFRNLFSEDISLREPLWCINSYPRIKEEEIMGICKQVENEEIRAALFQMGGLKAPGPDGLNALFYQSQWNRVGTSVCDFIKRVWREPKNVRDINNTLLVLIPKKDKPDEVTDLRPISLCNVIYKILTKVIANRLKWIMPKIISPNQSSFVPGRHSSDNIIVAQEVIHSMRSMKHGKGFMAIKIDLEKAYDRLNWQFLKRCLFELNLSNHLVNLIHECVSSPTLQLLWNGDLSEIFESGRGVRQGDPLSPYLFVICMEKLAHLIKERVDNRGWRPIKLCRDGPELSHLFFADDIILFSEASLEQAHELRSCLDQFCASSGLKVNDRKTRVFFSNNVHHNRRREISECL